MVIEFKTHMYSDYRIEYDNQSLEVHLSGQREDGEWIYICQWCDVNNPEDFSQGVEESIKFFLNNYRIEVIDI